MREIEVFCFSANFFFVGFPFILNYLDLEMDPRRMNCWFVGSYGSVSWNRCRRIREQNIKFMQTHLKENRTG